MKKLLNTILLILAFLFLVFLAVDALNLVGNFIDLTKYAGVMTKVKEYGALVLVGAAVIINVFGAGLLKIFAFIITLLVIIAYIVIKAAPDFIAGIF